MKYTKFFKQLSKTDVKIAGGKGTSLNEMSKAKMPVPSGFVITAESFDYFLVQGNIYLNTETQLAKINYNDMIET